MNKNQKTNKKKQYFTAGGTEICTLIDQIKQQNIMHKYFTILKNAVFVAVIFSVVCVFGFVCRAFSLRLAISTDVELHQIYTSSFIKQTFSLTVITVPLQQCFMGHVVKQYLNHQS